MLIRKLKDCPEFIGMDGCLLRETLNPDKDPDKKELNLRYSLAHARLTPGLKSKPHRLKNSEVYFIISGEGIMHINAESAAVASGDTVYIPPGAMQHLENTGRKDIVFVCIVDPAWRAQDEEVF